MNSEFMEEEHHSPLKDRFAEDASFNSFHQYESGHQQADHQIVNEPFADSSVQYEGQDYSHLEQADSVQLPGEAQVEDQIIQEAPVENIEEEPQTLSAEEIAKQAALMQQQAEQLIAEQAFWQQRKESFVRLKLWEEDRKNKSLLLGKVLITMTENILHRMAAAVIENEIFTNYLESMIKIQVEHTASLTKNASKYLDPLRQAYETLGSQNQHFIQSLKDLDVTHANNLVETTKQIKELIKANIGKNTELIKKTAEKLQSTFNKQSKNYNDKMKSTEKAFTAYVANFEQNEEHFRNDYGAVQEKDLWFTQYQFLREAREVVEALNQLKETLFLAWEHGKDKELARMRGLKELYDGIITGSQAIFGQNPAQEAIVAKINGIDQQVVSGELFSFNALISENELKMLMQLNDLTHFGLSFMKATDADIKNLFKEVHFEQAPESNLEVKKSLVKRESGAFQKFKDGTAVLTSDNYLYIFDWKILSPEGQTFSQPKRVVNMNNLQKYDVKKDKKIELVETKKGLFSSSKKTVFQPLTLDDMEEWVRILDKILKK